jgi:hypothetical protein
LPMVMSTAIAFPVSNENLPAKAGNSAAIDDLGAWQAALDEYHSSSKYFPWDEINMTFYYIFLQTLFKTFSNNNY